MASGYLPVTGVYIMWSDFNISPALIVGILVVVLVLFTLKKGVYFVPQGYNFVVERLGKYVRTFDPGLHLMIPYIYKVSARVNMKEQVLDVPSQEVITKDNAMVTANGVVFYQVINASQAVYEVNDLEYAILNLTLTNIRTVMGSMDLDELLSKRDQINAQLLGVVDDATSPWGIKVTRIEIKDIDPPTDLVDAMARQMKAEREKRANILEAEGFKQAAILKASGEKESAILQADGEKEAAFREAEARERLAQAEAEATRVLSESIEMGSAQAINYFIAQKYVEAMGKFANSSNQKLMVLPMEVTNLMGTIGGVAEIAKEAMEKQKNKS
ncbi:MAG: paraslipin [Gammaproteobacteria bacterium]|nr:MAG: paraslipin [Gammaproteobacteria bacterium]